MSHRRAKTIRQILAQAGFVWSSNKLQYRGMKKNYGKTAKALRKTVHRARDRFKGPPLYELPAD